MSQDECRVNCIQYVGGRNLKTHPDVRHLFKDFRDVLYVQWKHMCVQWPIPSHHTFGGWSLVLGEIIEQLEQQQDGTHAPLRDICMHGIMNN